MHENSVGFRMKGKKRGKTRMEVKEDSVKNVCQRGLDVSGDADGNSPREINHLAAWRVFLRDEFSCAVTQILRNTKMQ